MLTIKDVFVGFCIKSLLKWEGIWTLSLKFGSPFVLPAWSFVLWFYLDDEFSFYNSEDVVEN